MSVGVGVDARSSRVIQTVFVAPLTGKFGCNGTSRAGYAAWLRKFSNTTTKSDSAGVLVSIGYDGDDVVVVWLVALSCSAWFALECEPAEFNCDAVCRYELAYCSGGMIFADHLLR